MAVSFKEWLAEQCGRDDAVGTFSKLVDKYKEFPSGVGEAAEYLLGIGLRGAALEATERMFDAAATEYLERTGGDLGTVRAAKILMALYSLPLSLLLNLPSDELLVMGMGADPSFEGWLAAQPEGMTVEDYHDTVDRGGGFCLDSARVGMMMGLLLAHGDFSEVEGGEEVSDEDV